MTVNKVESIFELGHCPKKAMLLAAGLGKRMRPITDAIPKPLIRVHGKALIDHALDALVRAGVEHVVVNVHYLAEQVETHLESRNDVEISISDEREQLLDSGGGVLRALPVLGDQPFFLLNADSFWIEGFHPNLVRLANQYDANLMDISLLLAGMSGAVGFGTKGDFNMDADGRLKRRQERNVAPFAYAGAAIVHPRIFASAPQGAFSINRLFDEALENSRLFGLRLDGLWLHVGTPDAIDEAETAIARSAA